MFEWRENGILRRQRVLDLYFGGKRIGWIEQRPVYCDRGHWSFTTELPGTDDADSFPRYFMSLERAKAEAEEWSRWKMSLMMHGK